MQTCLLWLQVLGTSHNENIKTIIPLMFFVFPFTRTSIYMQTFNWLLTIIINYYYCLLLLLFIIIIIVNLLLLIVFFFVVEGGLDVGSFAVKLAHVNCFDWTDVCQKNNVTVYPTVKMFRWVLNHCKLDQYFIFPFILKTRSGLTWISGERV